MIGAEPAVGRPDPVGGEEEKGPWRSSPGPEIHQVSVWCIYNLWGCAHTLVCQRPVPRAADETKSWMNEKDTALLSDDYGRDLASVQALQRKHEGLERDLAALEDKVREL